MMVVLRLLLMSKLNWKRYLLFFLTFIVIIFSLRLIIFTLTPFFFGIIIATIIDRPVSFMSKRMPRTIAVLIMIVLVITISILAAFFIITNSVFELNYLLRYLPQYREQIMDFIDDLIFKLQDFFERMPNLISNVLQKNLDNLYSRGVIILSNMTERILNMTFNIPNMILILLFTIISSFYLSKDKEKLFTYFSSKFGFYNSSQSNILNDIFTYLKVQLFIMTNTSVLTAITFSLLNYPYAILLALLAGILDLIPVVGPGAILWPLIIINFIFNIKIAIVIFILYLIILGTRPILESRILGKRIGVHPLLLLIGVYVGLKLMGFQGVILAPISIIVFKAILDSGLDY